MRIGVDLGLPAATATFRGAIVALHAQTGRILWRSYSLPDNGGVPGGYAGATMFSSPAVDLSAGLVYGTFGQAYTEPAIVTACHSSAQTSGQMGPSARIRRAGVESTNLTIGAELFHHRCAVVTSGAQTSAFGRLLKRLNPMESNGHFLEKVIVNNRAPSEFYDWLASPVLFTVLVFGILFLYAGPGLGLDAGRASGSSHSRGSAGRSTTGRTRSLEPKKLRVITSSFSGDKLDLSLEVGECGIDRPFSTISSAVPETGAAGRGPIEFNERYFRELFQRRPDLYLTVRDETASESSPQGWGHEHTSEVLDSPASAAVLRL